jgi:hypothetical protein
MGGALGTVDDVILDSRGRDARKLFVRGGRAETVAYGEGGASRCDLCVLNDWEMLLNTLNYCRNAFRDVGQFAAWSMKVCGSRRDSRTGVEQGPILLLTQANHGVISTIAL